MKIYTSRSVVTMAKTIPPKTIHRICPREAKSDDRHHLLHHLSAALFLGCNFSARFNCQKPQLLTTQFLEQQMATTITAVSNPYE